MKNLELTCGGRENRISLRFKQARADQTEAGWTGSKSGRLPGRARPGGRARTRAFRPTCSWSFAGSAGPWEQTTTNDRLSHRFGLRFTRFDGMPARIDRNG